MALVKARHFGVASHILLRVLSLLILKGSVWRAILAEYRTARLSFQNPEAAILQAQ
jgi:hypothetical protein